MKFKIRKQRHKFYLYLGIRGPKDYPLFRIEYKRLDQTPFSDKFNYEFQTNEEAQQEIQNIKKSLAGTAAGFFIENFLHKR